MIQMSQYKRPISQYTLLKALPVCEAGTVFEILNDNDKPTHQAMCIMYAPVGRVCPAFTKDEIEANPDWFEPVNEWPKSWEDLIEIEGYFLKQVASISHNVLLHTSHQNKNIFPTPAHAQSALAFAQLSQLAKVINGDWEADWNNSKIPKYVIHRGGDSFFIDFWWSMFHPISFHSKEAAEFSLEHHRDLWEQYYMLK